MTNHYEEDESADKIMQEWSDAAKGQTQPPADTYNPGGSPITSDTYNAGTLRLWIR